jgi:hypothetical protein
MAEPGARDQSLLLDMLLAARDARTFMADALAPAVERAMEAAE